MRKLYMALLTLSLLFIGCCAETMSKGDMIVESGDNPTPAEQMDWDEPSALAKVNPLKKDGQYYTSFALALPDGTDIIFSGKMLKESDCQIITEDITDDGTPDYIIILVSESYNDVHREEIHVFDGVTLAEYCVNTDTISSTISNNVSSEWHSEFNYNTLQDDDSYVLHIDDINIIIPHSYLESEYLYKELVIGENYRYSINDNKIHVSYACFSGWNEICGYIIWDFSFSPSEMYFQPQNKKYEKNDTLFTQIAKRKKQENIIDGDFVYAYYKNGLKIVSYSGEDKDLVIPKTYHGIPIVCIGQRSFWEGCGIYSIIMNDIYEIGDEAFVLCKQLNTVTAPQVISIGGYAFQSEQLYSISLDNATNIGNYAFDGCSNLTEINLPNIVRIGDCAFYNTSVVEIYLPLVMYIGREAFSNCYSLRTIYLPITEVLENDVFHSCENLTIYTRTNNTSVRKYYEKYSGDGKITLQFIE